jgi:hypothetical protein
MLLWVYIHTGQAWKICLATVGYMVRHIFQACPVWIYTQSNITQASYSPEYITPTQQILVKNTSQISFKFVTPIS